jgi:hypothetical protein
MKPTLNICINSLLTIFLLASNARAGVILSVVLNPSYTPTSGIAVPNSALGVTAVSGETITARVFAQLTAPTSLATYVFTMEYDRNELSYVAGSRAETPSNLPGLSELDTTNAVNTAFNATSGRLFAIDGNTFGTGPTAPLGPVQIATATFTASNPSGLLDGSDFDIRVGAFNTGIDGFFDNGFTDLIQAGQVTFQNGSVSAVPEPTSLLLMSAAGLGFTLARRRRKLAA